VKVTIVLFRVEWTWRLNWFISGGPFEDGFVGCGWEKGDQVGGTGGPSYGVAVVILAKRRGGREKEARIEESEERMRRVEFIAVKVVDATSGNIRHSLSSACDHGREFTIVQCLRAPLTLVSSLLIFSTTQLPDETVRQHRQPL